MKVLKLIKKNFIASLFSYVVASLVAFFVGSIKLLPFIMLFGLYAIIQWLLDFYMYPKLEINKWIKIAINVVIKIIYFGLVFWGIYALMNLTLTDFNILNINWTMPLLVFVCFILFLYHYY